MIISNKLCSCGCGNYTSIAFSTRGGAVRGQPNKYIRGHQPHTTTVFKDIAGQKFGKLLALRRVPKPKHIMRRAAYWLCLCDCGKEHITQGRSLRSRMVLSCGCVRNKEEEVAFHKIWNNYRSSARLRNLAFTLTKEQIRSFTKQNCTYCGAAPAATSTSQGGYSYKYTGIDRLDNTKGYMLDNCVPCCRPCNHAKNTMSQTDFFLWIKRIYERCNLGGV